MLYCVAPSLGSRFSSRASSSALFLIHSDSVRRRAVTTISESSESAGELAGAVLSAAEVCAGGISAATAEGVAAIANPRTDKARPKIHGIAAANGPMRMAVFGAGVQQAR